MGVGWWTRSRAGHMMAAAGHQAREQWEPIWNCPPGSTRRIYLGNQVWDFDASEQHEQTCVHSSVNQM